MWFDHFSCVFLYLIQVDYSCHFLLGVKQVTDICELPFKPTGNQCGGLRPLVSIKGNLNRTR